MFSENFKNLNFSDLKAIELSAGEELLILNKSLNSNLTYLEILKLLSFKTTNLEFLKKTARIITKKRHGNVIKLYAPLYISNECVNSCVYCGFNVKNNINRISLNEAEIFEETKFLSKMGIKHLLLVAGESKKNFDFLIYIIKKIKNLFSSISIEIAPLEKEEYEILFKAGVDGVTCYQETYNKDLYKTYHPSGPKADFTKRLNTLDRAGMAELRVLGIGSLLGLNNFKEELFYLVNHALYLQKKYWRSQINISFPRLRPCSGSFVPNFVISDSELTFMICILRIIFPDANLVLSTRESQDFRNIAIGFGITQISAGSKTSPLGYSNKLNSGEQFEINDARTPFEMKTYLNSVGYDAIFKDWDDAYRC